MTQDTRERSFHTRTGLKLHALESGAPGAPPLLMLHGWLDNAASFSGLMPALNGRRAIALDLPGHGLSDHLPDVASRHFIDWVLHVDDAADALELDSFELVGHSMGAAIALLYAGMRPERVEKLVLIEGLGPLTTPPEDAPAQARRALAQRSRAMHRAPRELKDLDEAVARMLAARMPMSATGAHTIAARNTHRVDGGLQFSYDPMLQTTSMLRLTEAHLLAFIDDIEASTLLIRASEGWPSSPEITEARLARFDAIQVEHVEGGHHVHLDAPERVAPLVQEFLGIEG